jgi:Arc/MetJ-type ribon-helix-helix transcriptional regulator
VKTLTVRLPAPLVAEIEAESRQRRISKSDVVRERLRHGPRRQRKQTRNPLAAIADLVGSVHGGPSDMSANVKRYLDASGYGKKPPR